ncbi:MAG: dihydropteroate synthase [Chloroflexota bacterium]
MAANVWPRWGRRTYLMGVVNATPDSFSGDGLLGSPEGIETRIAELVARGADIIDVGGESTRPGFTQVPAAMEIDRVLPFIGAITAPSRVPVSIDTTKAVVARQAIAAGATIVNDISGLSDPDMAWTVAAQQSGLAIVHNHPIDAGQDLVAGMLRHLDMRVNIALKAGVPQSHIVIDPGLGMGKDWRANLKIVQRLAEFRALGLPLLVGPSRKGTIGKVLGVGVDDRVEGTASLVAVCIAHGADIVRVHDVQEMARVARMTDALVAGKLSK